MVKTVHIWHDDICHVLKTRFGHILNYVLTGNKIRPH